MNLKDYKDNEKTAIENLTAFIDDNAKWQEDYIENCEDFLNNYLECCEGEIYTGELDDDIKFLVEYLIDIGQQDAIYDVCEGQHTKGYHRVSNEIYSIGFGEVEVQFSGLYDQDTKTNCIYTELIKGMSEDDIKKAIDGSDQCVSGDCLYLDYTYDRASLILNEDELINSLKAV